MSGAWPVDSLEERVRKALDEVQPGLQADGGDVQLVAVEGDEVQVHLVGACDGCPMARSTLADFVIERVQMYAPEISKIVAV